MFQAVQLLLRASADPTVADCDGNTPLHCACLSNTTQPITAREGDVTERQNDAHCTTVENAIPNEMNEPGNTRTETNADQVTTHEEGTKFVNENVINPAIIQELLDAMTPGDVTIQNDEGNTPLMVANQFGNTETVRLLLSQPNAKQMVNLTNHQRQTALHLATQYQSTRTVTLLLQNNANVNRR